MGKDGERVEDCGRACQFDDLTESWAVQLWKAEETVLSELKGEHFGFPVAEASAMAALLRAD